MKKRSKRALGIDYGLKRIGLAISDENKWIATPLTLLITEKKMTQTAEKLLHEIARLEEKYYCEIDEIILGIPLHMNGQIGMMADEVNHFAETLKQLTSRPIILRDERLTSVQADRSLREGNLSRKKRAQKVDCVTAAIILQNYMDYLKVRDSDG